MGCSPAIEPSKGGLSTKIHTTVDALGNPIGFHLTEGQACELDGADVLLPLLEARTVIADKGFDADKGCWNHWKKPGKKPSSHPKANRKVQREYDKELYKARHLIENVFAKLRLFRCIATRYDKTAKKLPSCYPPRGYRHLAQLDDTP
jgi:transposase